MLTNRRELTGNGGIRQQIVTCIILIIITMIILLLDNRNGTIIRKVIVEDKSNIVFPLSKEDLRMVSIGVVVLELVSITSAKSAR